MPTSKKYVIASRGWTTGDKYTYLDVEGGNWTSYCSMATHYDTKAEAVFMGNEYKTMLSRIEIKEVENG